MTTVAADRDRFSIRAPVHRGHEVGRPCQVFSRRQCGPAQQDRYRPGWPHTSKLHEMVDRTRRSGGHKRERYAFRVQALSSKSPLTKGDGEDILSAPVDQVEIVVIHELRCVQHAQRCRADVPRWGAHAHDGAPALLRNDLQGRAKAIRRRGPGAPGEVQHSRGAHWSVPAAAVDVHRRLRIHILGEGLALGQRNPKKTISCFARSLVE
eukprot:scaffold3351_cov242-Pinguiococcus_pyrenoidosus.AAC.2